MKYHKKPYPKRKHGMLVLVLAAALSVILVIFASMLNRMRQEAFITNKVAVNERLFQVASAIARISIRKLQNDFNLREPNHGQKIIDLTFSGKLGKQEEIDYTSVISQMKATQQLVKEFKDKWGKQGDLTYTVKYIMDLGTANPYSEPIPGVAPNEYERKGHLDMAVTVSLDSIGAKKKFTIRKNFILARLLAPPFYRFTLFSHKGANLTDDVANSIEFDDRGKSVSSNKRPMICINRRIENNSAAKSEVNYAQNPENVIRNAPSNKLFTKNGWIYLGGKGHSSNANSDNDLLILNVPAGTGGDGLESSFGEFFHFYFNASSHGWMRMNNWDNWLQTNVANNTNDRICMSMVSYGIYKGLWDAKFAGKSLFKDEVQRLYDLTVSGADKVEKGSALHLFGTPDICTPTLIFGKVFRRYLLARAIYFTDLGRTFPLHAAANVDDVKYIFNVSMPVWYSDSYQNKYNQECTDSFYDDVSTAFLDKFLKEDTYKTYYNGKKSQNLTGLGPKIVDTEPYLYALKNMSDPNSPGKSWSEAVPNNNYVKNDCDGLCVENYNFTQDEESLFSGDISEIKIDYDTYLRDRTGYTITSKDGPVSIKNNQFIQKHFFKEGEGLFDKKTFHLNQIVRIDGDLKIDQELNVSKGGIIICTGKITIDEPILNKYIEGDANSMDNADCFGLLTLIAQNGIEVNSGKSASPMRKLEAFLIATNDSRDASVKFNAPTHVIGGVVSDKIDDIVNKGCIIEWGFDPGECTDLSCKDFYGLVLGPRDIEIFSGE